MRIIFAMPETLVCAGLTTAGVYMLNAGMTDKSVNAPILVIGGAVIFAFGVVTLQAVVRSILWHRAMLRRAIGHHGEPARHMAAGQD